MSEEGTQQGTTKKAKSRTLGQTTAVPTAKLCMHCKKPHENKPCYCLTRACFKCGDKDTLQGIALWLGRQKLEEKGAEEIEAHHKMVSDKAFTLTGKEVDASANVITGSTLNQCCKFPFHHSRITIIVSPKVCRSSVLSNSMWFIRWMNTWHRDCLTPSPPTPLSQLL